MGAVMNRSLTIRTGQCHVQRYMKPLLERIENGEIDPSFVITPPHGARATRPQGYEMFKHKQDDCVKVVLSRLRDPAELARRSGGPGSTLPSVVRTDRPRRLAQRTSTSLGGWC